MLTRLFNSRVYSLTLIFLLLIISQLAMNIDKPTHFFYLSLEDWGHRWLPPLAEMFGYRAAIWVWWLGSMLMEAGFAGAILAILFFGKGMRLGIGLAIIALFHSIFWHFTVMPIPQDILWNFPLPTGEIAMPEDFWFSGHVGYVTLLALATEKRPLWVRVFAWVFVILVACLVLATRTHYSIDVIGSFFVAYSVHKFLQSIAA